MALISVWEHKSDVGDIHKETKFYKSLPFQKYLAHDVMYDIEYGSNDTARIEKPTCPAEPNAVYNNLPFSTFPPHLRIDAARNVALRAPCATSNEGIWVRLAHAR